MEKDIGEVMAARFQIEYLAIDHVRNRAKRVPIARMRVGECPAQPGKRYTRFHHRVFVDVNPVVVIDEIVAEGLAEDQPRDGQQANTNGDYFTNATSFSRAGPSP